MLFFYLSKDEEYNARKYFSVFLSNLKEVVSFSTVIVLIVVLYYKGLKVYIVVYCQTDRRTSEP